MKRWMWYVGVGVIVAIGIGAYGYARPAASPAPTAPPAPKAADSTPNPPMLSLPGAAPIQPLDGDYHASDSVWLLVSKTRPLADPQYEPGDLVIPSGVAVNTKKSAEEQKVRSLIAAELKAMLDTASQAGHELYVASGYRSHQLQTVYYSNYVRVSGEAEANKFSARPGQSEHQTGLAFDLASTSNSCYLETCFGDSEAGKWLATHAHEYGFTLRYPADKTDITGYQYEPWHFRYVGKDLADALHQSGLTLDEAAPYLDRLRDTLRARDQ